MISVHVKGHEELSNESTSPTLISFTQNFGKVKKVSKRAEKETVPIFPGCYTAADAKVLRRTGI